MGTRWVYLGEPIVPLGFAIGENITRRGADASNVKVHQIVLDTLGVSIENAGGFRGRDLVVKRAVVVRRGGGGHIIAG